jgi:hypothetical protein
MGGSFFRKNTIKETLGSQPWRDTPGASKAEFLKSRFLSGRSVIASISARACISVGGYVIPLTQSGTGIFVLGQSLGHLLSSITSQRG